MDWIGELFEAVADLISAILGIDKAPGSAPQETRPPMSAVPYTPLEKTPGEPSSGPESLSLGVLEKKGPGRVAEPSNALTRTPLELAQIDRQIWDYPLPGDELQIRFFPRRGAFDLNPLIPPRLYYVFGLTYGIALWPSEDVRLTSVSQTFDFQADNFPINGTVLLVSRPYRYQELYTPNVIDLEAKAFAGSAGNQQLPSAKLIDVPGYAIVGAAQARSGGRTTISAPPGKYFLVFISNSGRVAVETLDFKVRDRGTFLAARTVNVTGPPQYSGAGTRPEDLPAGTSLDALLDGWGNSAKAKAASGGFDLGAWLWDHQDELEAAISELESGISQADIDRLENAAQAKAEDVAAALLAELAEYLIQKAAQAIAKAAKKIADAIGDLFS